MDKLDPDALVQRLGIIGEVLELLRAPDFTLGDLLDLPLPTQEELDSWIVYINLVTNENGVVVGFHIGVSCAGKSILASLIDFTC